MKGNLQYNENFKMTWNVWEVRRHNFGEGVQTITLPFLNSIYYNVFTLCHVARAISSHRSESFWTITRSRQCMWPTKSVTMCKVGLQSNWCTNKLDIPNCIPELNIRRCISSVKCKISGNLTDYLVQEFFNYFHSIDVRSQDYMYRTPRTIT